MNEDPFIDLKEVIEKDIAATGFYPKENPPGREPTISGGLENKSKAELKNLYDQFLAYYEYVTDDITRLIGYVSVTKVRLDHASAAAVRRAHANPEYTNADLRKAGATTDPVYVEAQKDNLYFKTLLNMQEERRRKFSKCMDRLGRELWFRTQDDSKSLDFNGKGPGTQGGFSRGYRKLE